MSILIPSVELVDINELTIDGDNPNLMTERQLQALNKSINRYGFIIPIITNKDYLIADGEQRYTVAKQRGMKQVPVIRLDVSDVDRRLLRQVLNKLKGEHQLELDAYEYQRIIEAGNEDDLRKLILLSESELERTLQLIQEPKEIPPPTPIDEIETTIERGDSFQLGDSQLFCGDCVEAMKQLADEYVDFAMFSPPYWGLRDYGVDVQMVWGGNSDCEHEWCEKHIQSNPSTTGIISNKAKQSQGHRDYIYGFCVHCGAWRGQLGLEPHPNAWIQNMTDICVEIRRVLKKSGSIYLNVGDTYFGSGIHDVKSGKKSRGRSLNWKNDFIEPKVKPWSKIKDKAWLQPKQLLLMPSRLAIALQDEGWILRNDIIWHKPNPMPSSVKDRLNNTYEHIYHFVKNRRYYYDLDAIRQPHAESSVERAKYPHGMPIKTLGGTSLNSGMAQKENGMNEWWAKHGWNINPLGKNPGDYWNIPTQPFKGAHFAVYPEAICEQPILSSCPQQICVECGKPKTRITKPTKEYSKLLGYSWHNHSSDLSEGGGQQRRGQDRERQQKIKQFVENGKQKYKTVGWSDCGCNKGFTAGVVLDPMAGAGTTLLVAQKLNRNFIGIELNPKYCQIIVNRWEAYTGKKAVKLN